VRRRVRTRTLGPHVTQFCCLLLISALS
jgi:hypothetical protein